LCACQNVSQDSQEEAVEDANDGKDVRPTNFAVSELVLRSLCTTDASDGTVIPTSRKDDTSKEHADCGNGLHNATSDEHRGWTNEDEENKHDDGQEDHDCRKANEESSSFESGVNNTVKAINSR